MCVVLVISLVVVNWMFRADTAVRAVAGMSLR